MFHEDGDIQMLSAFNMRMDTTLLHPSFPVAVDVTLPDDAAKYQQLCFQLRHAKSGDVVHRSNKQLTDVRGLAQAGDRIGKVIRVEDIFIAPMPLRPNCYVLPKGQYYIEIVDSRDTNTVIARSQLCIIDVF